MGVRTNSRVNFIREYLESGQPIPSSVECVGSLTALVFVLRRTFVTSLSTERLLCDLFYYSLYCSVYQVYS